MVVGILSPGAMGSALGARLVVGGARVVVALDGRSERSRRLAAEAGLEDVGSVAALVREASFVLSVVPPEAALDAAATLGHAADGRTANPLVVDLNAISPLKARRLAAVLVADGLGAVDGAISGPPPRRPGTTRIYLSGPQAAQVAALPIDGVESIVVGDVIGAASAVKMCTASVYKGRVALLAQAFRTARTHGVVDLVLADLADSGLVDVDRAGASLGVASAKAWRYVAEMDEIAATQAEAGLTPDLFRALATVYAELAEHPVAETPEEVRDDLPLVEALDRISGEGEGPAAAAAPPRAG